MSTILDEHAPAQRGIFACWASWNRRPDHGLTPDANDPKTVLDMNVDVPAFRRVASDGELDVLQGARATDSPPDQPSRHRLRDRLSTMSQLGS